MRLKYLFLKIGFMLMAHILSAQTSLKTPKQEGKASYYADKFHGKLTASGERFNMHDYTAAHRHYPFNTLLRITNLSNNKTVYVRINDRGPYIPGRVLDISKAAAEELDMIQSGTAMVKFEPVGLDFYKMPDAPMLTLIKGPAKVAPPLPKSSQLVTGNTYSLSGTIKYPEGFGLQISAYNDIDNAKADCKALINKGINEVFIQVGWANGFKIFRVLVGDFKKKELAMENLVMVRQLGYDAFVKKHF